MYDNIRKDIYELMPQITGLNIVPDAMQIEVGSAPVARLSIIPGSSKFNNFGYSQKTLSGYVILAIFVKTESGHKELFDIADKIDLIMQNKKCSNGTTFASSSMDIKGIDPQDSSLFRGDYLIKFNYYGE
jgi:hypothetical protein